LDRPQACRSRRKLEARAELSKVGAELGTKLYLGPDPLKTQATISWGTHLTIRFSDEMSERFKGQTEVRIDMALLSLPDSGRFSLLVRLPLLTSVDTRSSASMRKTAAKLPTNRTSPIARRACA
jgi:hypothetical protein